MTRNLFIKYLQGSCSEEEFDQILLWIREGSQSISGKGIVQGVWEEFEPEAGPVERIKYNRILDKIHHQINIGQTPPTVVIQKASVKKRILSILTRVAAIVLLPVLSIFLYTIFLENDRCAANINDLEVEAPAGSRMHIELGDGTKVWLNHGSKLKYPYQFSGKDRKVFLMGEAFFEVAHNNKIPFIVGTNHLDVKATGTAFNVSAYPDDDFVETTLVEGKVILYEKNNNREIQALLPDECLKFNSQNNGYTLQSGNTEKHTAWKDGLLVFENDNIEDIAKKLERWYNIEIEISDEIINEYPFTATFTDETIRQVLELLSLATPVNYKLGERKKMPDGSFSKQEVIIGMKKIVKK